MSVLLCFCKSLKRAVRDFPRLIAQKCAVNIKKQDRSFHFSISSYSFFILIYHSGDSVFVNPGAAYVSRLYVSCLFSTKEHFFPEAVETSADGNWGLSFGQDGEPPAANATYEILAKYNAYYAEDTKEKRIYLTFDAGFENGNTEAILDALKKHHVPATFFVVGTYIKNNPELIRRMKEEGHTVGNHTYHHPDMSQISTKESFEKELQDVEAEYQKITGEEMTKFYRPPQGKYNEDNLRMAKELGYHTFFWSLAYVDWYEDDQPTKEEAFDKLLRRIHPGAIVLLHSTSKTNAEILDELLTKWEEMGYTFGSLKQLIS